MMGCDSYLICEEGPNNSLSPQPQINYSFPGAPDLVVVFLTLMGFLFSPSYFSAEDYDP